MKSGMVSFEKEDGGIEYAYTVYVDWDMSKLPLESLSQFELYMVVFEFLDKVPKYSVGGQLDPANSRVEDLQGWKTYLMKIESKPKERQE